MTKTILHTVTNANMGDASEADAHTWATYVTRRLSEEYPDADIDVRVNCLLSSETLEVHGENPDTVREFIARLWDRELAKAFPG